MSSLAQPFDLKIKHTIGILLMINSHILAKIFVVNISNSPSIGINESPWTANIFKFDYDRLQFMQRCSAVIIHKDWILTSASCLEESGKFEELMVVSGISNPENCAKEQVRYIMKIVKHQARRNSDAYDVVLAKLSTAFDFDTNTYTVNLPEENYKPKGIMMVAGWGPLKLPQLNSEEFNIAKNVTFEITNTKKFIKYTFYIDAQTTFYAEKVGNAFVRVPAGSSGVCKDKNSQFLCGMLLHENKIGASNLSEFASVPLFTNWIQKIIWPDMQRENKILKIDLIVIATLTFIAIMIIVTFLTHSPNNIQQEAEVLGKCFALNSKNEAYLNPMFVNDKNSKLISTNQSFTNK